jgi:hypothetical protein
LWNPNLHREFAALKPDLGPILNFANRFGLLGVGLNLEQREQHGSRFIEGERYWDWVSAISQMADHIRSWELVRSKDLARLRDHIVWGNDAWVGWRTGWRPDALEEHVTETIAVDYAHWREAEFHVPWEATNVTEAMRWGISRPGDLRRTGWRQGDVLGPAAAYVTRNINRRLGVHARVAVVAGRKGELSVVPMTLLGVLYGRFALEVVGRAKRGRFCAREGCGRPLLGVHGRRRFCGDECRKLDWARNNKRTTKGAATDG